MARRELTDHTQRQVVYDPCCGIAYHLSTLAYGHWHSIQEIIGSDIERQAVEVAQRNLQLLTPEGLSQRRQELADKYHEFGRESYRDALKSVDTLRAHIMDLVKQHPIRTRVFQASAFDAQALVSQLGGTRVDIVLTDVPYGQRSEWQGDPLKRAQNPISAMLAALMNILHAGSVVAVVSDKRQKITHDAYRRVERFQIGKRQVVLLKPLL